MSNAYAMKLPPPIIPGNGQHPEGFFFFFFFVFFWQLGEACLPSLHQVSMGLHSLEGMRCILPGNYKCGTDNAKQRHFVLSMAHLS